MKLLVEVSPTFASKLGTRLVLLEHTLVVMVQLILSGVALERCSDVALGDDVASATNFLVSGTSGLGIIRSTTSGELSLKLMLWKLRD